MRALLLLLRLPLPRLSWQTPSQSLATTDRLMGTTARKRSASYKASCQSPPMRTSLSSLTASLQSKPSRGRPCPKGGDSSKARDLFSTASGASLRRGVAEPCSTMSDPIKHLPLGPRSATTSLTRLPMRNVSRPRAFGHQDRSVLARKATSSGAFDHVIQTVEPTSTQSPPRSLGPSGRPATFNSPTSLAMFEKRYTERPAPRSFTHGPSTLAKEPSPDPARKLSLTKPMS
jgi:hypothetical protein